MQVYDNFKLIMQILYQEDRGMISHFTFKQVN